MTIKELALEGARIRLQEIESEQKMLRQLIGELAEDKRWWLHTPEIREKASANKKSN